MEPHLFQIDIKGLHGKCITQTHLGKICEHAFMYVRSGTHMHFHRRIIVVLTQNPTVLMFLDITGAPKL